MLTRACLIFLLACGATPKKTTGATGATGATNVMDTGSGTTSVAGAQDFTISAQAASVAQGGSKQINVTLTRTGGSFPVTLTMGEADAGVRAVFPQATTTANTVAVTIEVVSSVAVGSFHVVINASGANKMHSASVGVTVTAKMLAATVVDELLRPVVSADVWIGTTKMTSDTNGAFAMANVSGTYDVTVKKDDNIWVFKGLTRTDPTLQLFGYAPAQPFIANVTGAVQNMAPAPSGDPTVALVLGTSSCCGDAYLDASPGAYSVFLGWSVSAMTNATLHALEWAVAGDITEQGLYEHTPITFLRYGAKQNLGMSNNVLAGGQNVDLGSAALQNSTLAGSATTPSGYALLTRSAFVKLPGANASVQIAHQFAPGRSFSYQVPVISGATVGVIQEANHTTKGSAYAYSSDLAPPQTSVALAIPEVPTTNIPTGTVTAASTFTFSAMTGGGVHVVSFLPVGSGPRVYVVGTQTSTTLPNITVTGAAFPPAAPYTYTVQGFSPAGTMDAGAGADGYCSAHAMFQLQRAPKGSGTFAISTAKTFNTP